MARARSEDMKTPLARLSFPNLFKPQTKDNGTESYNAVLLFPKSTDLSQLKAAAGKCATDEWGDKAAKMIADGVLKVPFLDGDGPQGMSKKSGERHAGYAGHTFIRVASNQQPKVVTAKMLPATPDDVYAGCYVYAVVNAYAWEHPTNGRGISFGLSLMQVARDGERLGGGGADPDKHFQVIPDEGEAPAETKGGAGAAGLFA
jgi:hypothetical protein